MKMQHAQCVKHISINYQLSIVSSISENEHFLVRHINNSEQRTHDTTRLLSFFQFI